MQIRSIILAVLSILAVYPVHIQAQSDELPTTVEYFVTADSANIRSGAGTNFDIVGTVIKGDSLLIYDEPGEGQGWLRIYRPTQPDAYVADFLVERAPTRFYDPSQEPVFTAAGRGNNITDVFDIPRGAYRIDAEIEDNAFILEYLVVEGDCRDGNIFNELNFDVNRLTLSGLFVSSGCSVIFQTDNVDGNWEFEVRDLLAPDFFPDNVLTIENGTSISGTGRTLTMGTRISEGIWTISGIVEDQAFILHSNVLTGECDDTSVFNELDFGADILEISTVYRNPDESDCVVFWETDNVEGNWEIRFEKLR